MPSRTLCEVLEEMRKLYETRNFSAMLGLIEEAQIYANRMEGGLGDKNNYEYYRDERKKLELEVRKLNREIAESEEKKEILFKK